MARKYLFNPENKFYKANMHCHSKCSDGVLTPQEIKECFMEKGYSIVAYSDHEVLVPHPELTDENFVAITACEYAFSDPYNTWPKDSIYHFNVFSKDPLRDKFVPYDREFSVRNLSKIFKDAKEAGFITEYNHARWSYNTVTDYIGTTYMDYWEILNAGSESATCNGDGEYEYEMCLRDGMTCGVMAGDDNHGYPERYRGFTMISCPELTYDAVIKALENKECYASGGPLIYEAYIENNKLYIKTSEAKRIAVLTDTRASVIKYLKEGSMTEAVLDLAVLNNNYKYIRIVVEDEKRLRAWTRGYFKEEL